MAASAAPVSQVDPSPPIANADAPARLFAPQVIAGPDGALTVVEASKALGFPIHRIYVLKDVPAGGARGGHGHKALRQGFVALRGQVRLTISRKGVVFDHQLTAGGPGVVVAPGCWRDLEDFSADAVILVLASDEYDEADYLRDPWTFKLWASDQERVEAVPYLDLARYAPVIGPELELAMRRVVRSGVYIGGEAVGAFEREFAGYCGAAHAVGVANGLEALSLALRAWGVGPGDEVIAPAHTFIATVLAIQEVGATPILVDVEPDTGLMDMARVAEAITPRTRAVIPVHLYGHPADMDGLTKAIAGRDIHILEDAAQAHGALYRGRPCGSLGDAAAFSFYPTKNLGALGDGGAVTTHSECSARLVRRIANYGASERYHHDIAGVNSRLDPLQAAVLSAKLPRLAAWNARRRQIAQRYLAGLADIPEIALPVTRDWAEPVWHVFSITVPGARDALQTWLTDQGVGTNIHYPIPIHRQGACAGLWRQGAFPVSETLAASVLSLPLDPLHRDAEIDFVIRKVRGFFGRPALP